MDTLFKLNGTITLKAGAREGMFPLSLSLGPHVQILHLLDSYIVEIKKRLFCYLFVEEVCPRIRVCVSILWNKV